jgi:hypothetical protein
MEAPFVSHLKLAPHNPDFTRLFPSPDFLLATALHDMSVVAPPWGTAACGAGAPPAAGEGGALTALCSGQPLPLRIRPAGSADYDGPASVFWFDVLEARAAPPRTPAAYGDGGTPSPDPLLRVEDMRPVEVGVLFGGRVREFQIGVSIVPRVLVNGALPPTPEGLAAGAPPPAAPGAAPAERTRLEPGVPTPVAPIQGGDARTFFVTLNGRSGLEMRLAPGSGGGGGGGGGGAAAAPLPEVYVALGGVERPSPRRFLWADLACAGSGGGAEKVLFVEPSDAVFSAPPPRTPRATALPPSVQQLMETTGTTRSRAAFALRYASGDINAAVDLLALLDPANSGGNPAYAGVLPPPSDSDDEGPGVDGGSGGGGGDGGEPIAEHRTFSFTLLMPGAAASEPLVLTAAEVPFSDAASAARASAGARGAAAEPLLDAGEERCPRCKRGVPAGRMVTHEVRCKAVHRCATCSALLNPGDEARHVHCAAPGCAAPAFESEAEAARHAEVHHGAFACDECGAVGMTRGAVFEGHLAAACPRRVVACLFCGLKKFRADKLDDHQRSCGTKTDRCGECGNAVQRRHREAHRRSGCALPPLPQRAPRDGTSIDDLLARFRLGQGAPSHPFLGGPPPVGNFFGSLLGGPLGGGALGGALEGNLGGMLPVPLQPRSIYDDGGSPLPPPPVQLLQHLPPPPPPPRADDADVSAVIEGGLMMGLFFEDKGQVASALLHPANVGREDRVQRALQLLVNQQMNR